MANYSFTEENYIKAIYHLQSSKTTVTTNELAEVLKTKPASVTDMIKKLKRKKLVNYKPYYGCGLTGNGRSLALLIIRRHRLWEYFLHEKLGFAWDEVHDVAEELEHVGSVKLINKLDAFLGFPRVDPHGDPIPEADGTVAEIQYSYLADADINTTATIAQIKQQSPALLDILKQKKISIGSIITVLRKFDFDSSMEIKVTKYTVHITKELAENILIKNL